MPTVARDPAIVAAYLEDASGFPGGAAAGVARPASEEEAAALIARGRAAGERLLFQAARTSLTGGAVPRGETVVSVEKLRAIGPVRGRRVTVQPGVRLAELQAELARQGLYFPPVPTYTQAMVGGTVSTNAGGAATFKYGVTRGWVHGLRVVLESGELLELERGQELARPGGEFLIETAGTTLRVPVPDWRLPGLKKISAGYFAADPLDLVDLFVGSEGTLGLITAATLELVPLPPAVVTALVALPGEREALALAAALRAAVPHPDVRAIEYLDERCLCLLREHGDDRALRIELPPSRRAALLFELELRAPLTDEQAQEQLSAALEGGPGSDAPLARLGSLLAAHDALDGLELAFPEDAARRQALGELRERVPLRVNELLAERRRTDPAVRKAGGDLIVPVDGLGEMMHAYAEGFGRRGLDYAIWGHLSDGNLHPNALPRDAAETQRGEQAQLEFAEHAVRLGGCPLSEHGVGRSPLKQEMLRRFLGDPAIASMRRIKRALDPSGRLAPGVLFAV
ncbi:MAG TPA: FAD-binding oxidoreductase [Candidatus Polarisedimenticolaceae bacterium]|nr:FAD-binding oxidoreductase [Candidatus Polarisedimenticolaceae bacterium]